MTIDTSIIMAISAVASSAAATVALVFSIVFNVKTQNLYKRDREPMLSFSFEKSGCFLFLSVKNTGKSSAQNVNVEFLKIANNGQENEFNQKTLFSNPFILFPEEKIGDAIIRAGNDLDTCTYPVLFLSVSYSNDSKKKVKYDRTVTLCNDNNQEYMGPKESDYEGLKLELESNARGTTRIANYLEGNYLFPGDRLNKAPNGSLREDLKKAFEKE